MERPVLCGNKIKSWWIDSFGLVKNFNSNDKVVEKHTRPGGNWTRFRRLVFKANILFEHFLLGKNLRLFEHFPEACQSVWLGWLTCVFHVKMMFSSTVKWKWRRRRLSHQMPNRKFNTNYFVCFSYRVETRVALFFCVKLRLFITKCINCQFELERGTFHWEYFERISNQASE